MKKIFLLMIGALLLPPVLIRAQQTFTVAQAQDESNKKMTGNKEDVLANYIQLAANNLTSSGQNVTLKINWFALNMADSATKYNDKNYMNTRWQRNGQFQLSGGMDKNNKFNSLQAGVSYNVLNLADTTVFHYFSYYDKALLEIGELKIREAANFRPQVAAAIKGALDKVVLDEFTKKEKDRLKADIYGSIKSFPQDKNTDALIKAEQSKMDEAISAGKQAALKDLCNQLADYAASSMLDQALNKYTTSFGKQSVSFDVYVDAALIKQITDAIDTDIKADKLLQQEYKANSLTDVDTKITTQYENLVSYVARQPVITANINGNYGTGTSLPYIAGGFSGIWGLNKLGSQKKNQLTASLSDTLTQNSTALKSLNRNLGAAQAGINTVLVMDKKVSVMELNVGIEDDLLFSQPVTGTERNKFTFNATYRARLPGSPWLKLVLKYDPKAANVLGLLNFTYNLDNSSSSKK
jgi:hypothetical protein